MPLSTQDGYDLARLFAQKVFVEAANQANLNLDDIRTQTVLLGAFIEAQQVVINNQFTEPFKSTATVQQKRYILALAAMRLAGII